MLVACWDVWWGTRTEERRVRAGEKKSTTNAPWRALEHSVAIVLLRDGAAPGDECTSLLGPFKVYKKEIRLVADECWYTIHAVALDAKPPIFTFEASFGHSATPACALPLCPLFSLCGANLPKDRAPLCNEILRMIVLLARRSNSKGLSGSGLAASPRWTMTCHRWDRGLECLT